MLPLIETMYHFKKLGGGCFWISNMKKEKEKDRNQHYLYGEGMNLSVGHKRYPL